MAKVTVTELGAAVGLPADGLADFERLDADQLQVLVNGFGKARTRQHSELEAAIDSALGYLPRLLRGPVTKIIRG